MNNYFSRNKSSFSGEWIQAAKVQLVEHRVEFCSNKRSSNNRRNKTFPSKLQIFFNS